MKSPPEPKAKPAARASAAGKSSAKAKASSKASSQAQPRPKRKPAAREDESNSPQGDWRGETLAHLRALILKADPEMIEEVKWRKPSNPAGVPVWSHDGIVCTGETYKNVVKLTFAQGAKLPDPARLFNASLEAGTRRAIDIREGKQVDARAFKALVKAAVAQNSAPAKKVKPAARQPERKKLQPDENGVVLLSGGNPQIAKGDGDAPVQAYIAAMPGWKHNVGRQLDALIVRTLPNVRKAVRWNSPFYGIEGQGWFLAVHCLTKYVKVTFFQGLSLQPIPPGGTPKSKEGRWIDIYEDDEFDEAQMTMWVKQAAAIPGWTP